MNRPVTHKKNLFTLVEIMIAMAVLVIMMGFLFQFINSAQRMWSASESTSNTFDQAQILLQLLENDFQSALFSNDKENPGCSIPMGIEYDSTNSLNNKLFMVAPDTNAADNVKTNLIMYAVKNGQLSRYVFDSSITGYSAPHCFYGFDPFSSSTQAEAFLSLLTTLENDINKQQVLVTGVESVKFKFLPFDSATNPITGNTEAFFFTAVPQMMRITMSLYDAKAVKVLTDSGLTLADDVVKNKIAETKRVFTKIIFLR